MFLISICLLVAEKRRIEVLWFMIIGDMQFVCPAGHPHLLGREGEMILPRYDSLHIKSLPLSKKIDIYPGPQPDCVSGEELSGESSSTACFEKP